MSTELALADKFDRMNKIVDLNMEGYTPPQIARALGIKQYEVKESLDQYKEIISHDRTVVARAREALTTLDTHTSKAIRKAYEVAEAAEEEMSMNGVDSKLLGQKLAAIKAVMDFEAKRFGMLKDYGLLDDLEMGNQVAEVERKQELLMGILRDVTSTCLKCKPEVIDRLSRITGDLEGITIVENV